MSSMAPRTQTIVAPASTPHSSPVANISRLRGRTEATRRAAPNPRYMATPPSRGMTVSWTSRSRTAVKARTRNASNLATGVVR